MTATDRVMGYGLCKIDKSYTRIAFLEIQTRHSPIYK